MEEEHDKIKKQSRAGFINFINLAEKDFNLFNDRLGKDFTKYKNQVKDEAVNYDLKTKANLIAKEAEKLISDQSLVR